MTRRIVRPWRCPNGHVMGMIEVNAARLPVLLLYRHAVDEQAATPADVDVIAVHMGSLADARCDVCGEVAEWVKFSGRKWA